MDVDFDKIDKMMLARINERFPAENPDIGDPHKGIVRTISLIAKDIAIQCLKLYDEQMQSRD